MAHYVYDDNKLAGIVYISYIASLYNGTPNTLYFGFIFFLRSHIITTSKVCTVCPGSSEPPEKNILIYLHQKIRLTPFFNYHDILGCKKNLGHMN